MRIPERLPHQHAIRFFKRLPRQIRIVFNLGFVGLGLIVEGRRKKTVSEVSQDDV
ncbi:MAG: hypothetical protein ACI91J_003538, partial [Yoonia sp.]